jgi:hypothetical protein
LRKKHDSGEDSPVELSLAKGKLVIQALTEESLSLQDLLRGVTNENVPDEWDTGRALSNEHW